MEINLKQTCSFVFHFVLWLHILVTPAKYLYSTFLPNPKAMRNKITFFLALIILICTAGCTSTGETFAQNSGDIVCSASQKNTTLVTGLNFPNSIKRGGLITYYIAETYDGKILKVIL